MYAVIRSALDLIRLDSATTGPFTDAQLVSVGIFLVALAILVIRHRRPAAPTEQAQLDAKKPGQAVPEAVGEKLQAPH